MDTSRRRTSAIDAILNRPAPRHEPEVDEARSAFDEVRAPKTRGREAVMLDVRRSDGHQHALAYAYLNRVDFQPGDQLRLHFGGAVVQIQGRRLSGLYRRLLEHRVEAIQEGTDAEEDAKPSNAAHIDQISIHIPKEADHGDDD